ncbi:MAG: M23 family metallopeptidase [Bacteroidales bacterium]|nr:M23 family metallopeptidase [Candidatus Latescibacterota bacterium]
MDRYFTFLYVRRGNAGVKSIRIHRYLAFGSAAFIIALVLSTIIMATQYSGAVAESEKLIQLQLENEGLMARLERFEREVDNLQGNMAVNLELQNRARLMANLDPISADVWQVGIGGPEPGLIDRELSATDRVFSGLRKDIDRIVRQSVLQKESYKELLDILEKEVEIRNCTPSIRPLKGGFLSSNYGRRMDPFTGRITFHKGLDYFARTGTPVMAAADGIITMAKKNGSMGLTVEVNHGNGFKTRYAHLSRILVKRGQKIKRAETLGQVGNTGRSTGPHLHYEVLFRKDHRNPLNYIIPDDVYYD